MVHIKKVTKTIDSINNFIGKVGAWSVVIIMFLVVFEVITRRVFGSPTIWTFETITMIFGFYFLIIGAYAVLHKSIVSVDLLYERFSLKTKAILDIVTYLILFFPFVIGIFYFSIGVAEKSWIVRETTSSLFGAPVYLLKTVIPVAFGLLLLQGISELLKSVYVLIKGVEV